MKKTQIKDAFRTIGKQKVSFISIILIAFMFFGRVGGLTLAYAMISMKRKEVSRYPAEKLTVG